MGMYDNINVAKSILPTNTENLSLLNTIHLFQTKSFEDINTCSLHEITKEGKLIVEDYEYGQRIENRNYTGIIAFYDIIKNEKGWIEFLAEFKDGNLIEIKEIIKENKL